MALNAQQQARRNFADNRAIDKQSHFLSREVCCLLGGCEDLLLACGGKQCLALTNWLSPISVNVNFRSEPQSDETIPAQTIA